MNAYKVAERLYGDDDIKCEIIRLWLTDVKKLSDAFGDKNYDEFIESISEGCLDKYMMPLIEFCEDHFDLEVLADKLRKNTNYNIPMHIFKKIVEICKDENALSVADKNSAKRFFQRLSEIEEK